MDKDTEKAEKQARRDDSISTNNQRAVMAALDVQNKKLHEFEVKINGVTAELTKVYTEFAAFRKERVEELIKKMGHGPTAIME